MDKTPANWKKAAFFAYCAFLLVLLFHRRPLRLHADYWDCVRQNINLSPFDTIRLFFGVLRRRMSAYYIRLAVVNLFGNVLVFVPVGFGLPWAFARMRRLWRTLAVTGAAVVLVELAQLLTLRGVCDIDDLLLNLLGTALGCSLFALARRRTTE